MMLQVILRGILGKSLRWMYELDNKTIHAVHPQHDRQQVGQPEGAF